MEKYTMYESNMDRLVSINRDFEFLREYPVNEWGNFKWYKCKQELMQFHIQAMFVGKTGYGKSTTLNSIIGKDIFNTSDTESCTKRIDSAEYKIHSYKEYIFSFCDLPGIGESLSADEQYIKWYREMLAMSNCIVYILRADQRDFSNDEKLFSQFFRNNANKNKLILAINCADKIEPVNRSTPFRLSEEQRQNLKEKKQLVGEMFNVFQSRIIFYSATEKYALNKLTSKIAEIVRKNL